MCGVGILMLGGGGLVRVGLGWVGKKRGGGGSWGWWRRGRGGEGQD